MIALKKFNSFDCWFNFGMQNFNLRHIFHIFKISTSFIAAFNLAFETSHLFGDHREDSASLLPGGQYQENVLYTATFLSSRSEFHQTLLDSFVLPIYRIRHNLCECLPHPSIKSMQKGVKRSNLKLSQQRHKIC